MLGRVREVGGTVTGIVGMNAILATALGAGTLTRQKRMARNLTAGKACAWVFTAGGVKLDVHGREHLEAPRPAVYIFNHTSNLDPLVVSALVDHDFTAVGKAEVGKDPVALIAAHALDAVLIDRKDSEKARAALNTLASRVAAGESLVISPEGTRHPGPEPGEFKLGPFHVAANAGVPVVPVALVGAERCMPRGSSMIRPGTIGVRVMEPVDGWTRENIRPKAEQLRAAMAAEIRAAL